jgi:hypothetical protein
MGRTGAKMNKRKEGESSSPRCKASRLLLGGGEANGREIAGGLRWRSDFERRLRGANEEERRRLVWGVGELRLSFYKAEGRS